VKEDRRERLKLRKLEPTLTDRESDFLRKHTSKRKILKESVTLKQRRLTQVHLARILNLPSFTGVSKLIEKVLKADARKVSNQIFNAGGAMNNYTKKMVVDEILKLLPHSKIKYLAKGSDPRNYKVDFTKVEKTLDFSPKYTVFDGVSELFNAINNHGVDMVETHKEFFGNYYLDYGK
jgi:hypothetical protein